MATVADVMSRQVRSVDADTTVAEAAGLMSREGIGSLLLRDGDALQGIFTERDIVRALSLDSDAPRQSLSHWMTRDPRTIEPTATVEEALDRMLAGGFRHLPVLEAGRLVGMVSMRDLVAAEA